MTVHPIRPVRDLISLGPRQAQILGLILEAAQDGRVISDRELAETCGIGVPTVKTLNRRICSKFGVRNKPELVLLFSEVDAP